MYLQLFDSVRITEGAKRALIFDTATGFISFIPKSFSALLSDRNRDYALLRQESDDESKEALDQYLEFIQHHRLGIFVEHKDELAHFRTSDETALSTSEVDYFIFDLHPSGLTSGIAEQIDQMGIKFVQLRILNGSHSKDIMDLFSRLSLFNDTSVNEVSIVLAHHTDLEDCIVAGEVITSNRYLQFLFHSSEHEERKTYGNIEVSKMTKAVRIPEGCGCVNVNTMNRSRLFYTEALHHNSCLHKKMAIDKDGNIRNCPSMPKAFGNIKNTTLQAAFRNAGFKEYWSVTKDRIKTCKDCEFRYICTDCRAYTERSNIDSDGIDLSKPLKCGYDPYTAQWQEGSTHVLKHTAAVSTMKSGDLRHGDAL
ncbi:grasp-with-spasm system SPASM domain peptide maturase [Chryseobacterium gregarium]|uniref:grasp-with-spasm system SPASM domain peptide maturase n=1 Tax=Chryseobacterium gregarium TaxID=456299 RepID=UPI00040A6270|nr:grasp-with-spasm system SPASM domain peptide maturase [Chryseobacterium gregarium]